MLRKIKKRLRAWHEAHEVKHLEKSGLFDKPGDINKEKKELHLGYFSMSWTFGGPRDRLAMQFLNHWYGWKCYEKKIRLVDLCNPEKSYSNLP